MKEQPDLVFVEEKVSIEATDTFIRESNRLRDSGANEEPMKANLFHHLPLMFPTAPRWINHHIAGAEASVRVRRDQVEVNRFTDSLVGATSIEYEPDLRRGDRYKGGLEQVREHCAGLINSGYDPDKIIGILSDSVIWLAYTVELAEGRPDGPLSKEDIVLKEVDRVDTSTGRVTAAKDVLGFLLKYLGRHGSRRLEASTIASDLGFDTTFGLRHMEAVRDIVDRAFSTKPAYAKLIRELWRRFVAIAGSSGRGDDFDRSNYADELYLVTLAKLICANVLAQKALRSTDDELMRILNGSHFISQGLDNLVEYDYFGWLTESPHVQLVVPIARDLQEDLHAYDFEAIPPEDIFGHLMAQLGRRTRRLLLGQEFTPSWLAKRMANHLFEALPPDTSPQFVDMCCGSGAMLVAVCSHYGSLLEAEGADPSDPANLHKLAQSATGFDIDPLAVMLAKVNWVVTNRSWINGGARLSIPVYHADSLFADVPFADDTSGDAYPLRLHDRVTVSLPAFLIQPECRLLFDDLIHRAYGLARAAKQDPLEKGAARRSSEAALADFEADTEVDVDVEMVHNFFRELATALATLHRDDLNGVWAFILKNSYRPSLVTGQFNGLISNPPWLALSKVADNPYAEALKGLAAYYGLTPPGASHLHTELATVFLIASVDRYLAPAAVISCVLPDTVLNGHHHRPFRDGTTAASSGAVAIAVDELWRVHHGTFKNEAIVFVGHTGAISSTPTVAGRLVGPDSVEDTEFKVVKRGDRVIWTDTAVASEAEEFFNAGEFRQGADLMPRTVVFHELHPEGERWSVGPIDRQSSELRYLVKDAKEHKDFRIEKGNVDDTFVYGALLSNHLVPFSIDDPALCLLPFHRLGNEWRPLSSQQLAADPQSASVFNQVFAELGDDSNSASFLHRVETDRRKLSIQEFGSTGYLVVYGAGGSVVAAAYRPLDSFDRSKLIVDQTLYWNIVESEDEALYLTGLFNSEIVNTAITPFQPKGQRGKRHIHRLPVIVTPRFDPTDPEHEAVVSATRRLLQDWRQKMTDPSIQRWLDPTRALASRRSALRKALAGVESYQAFEEACLTIYADKVSSSA